MVKFGINTKFEKEYLHDLLIIEDFLVWGASIGWAEEYPFNFKVEDDERIAKKPTPLAKEARDWVNKFMKGQVELGVYREVDRSKEDDPQFAVNVVLVRGG